MKKMITFILVLCMILTVAACTNKDNTPENTTPATTTPAETTTENTNPTPETPTEITLEEVYEAGKNLLALLGNHENVYACVTSEGKVIREEYLSKQYGYSYYSADFMNIGFEYATFATATNGYTRYDGTYAIDVVLTPDGLAETYDLLTMLGTSAFISSAVLNDEVTIVEEDGFIIVACNADSEDLLLMGDNVVSCVETYTLDAKTREMVSIKTVYTYEDGSVDEGVVTITRDVEEPESMKPFLAYAQETAEKRTVTIVSNPGTENEKIETVQAPKGLQIAFGSDWDVEETLTLYADAACTQLFEETEGFDQDITVYVKWEEAPAEITLEEVYEAGKNYAALLGDHENVFVQAISEGEVLYEIYLSHEYACSFYGPKYFDIGFSYSNLVTDTAQFYFADDIHALIVTLTPNGVVEITNSLELAGENSFVSSSVLNEIATVTEENGLIIVSCIANIDEIYTDEGVIACVETYTLDAITRELLEVKTTYTYEDGTVKEGIATITRDVEAPEGMKPFLAYAQETAEKRTVTIVSNPGTENEKIETVQAPKGLQIAFGSDWDVEETLTLYADAACTQLFEETEGFDQDVTVYVKWEESIPEDEIRYTVTQEEWDAAVVEKNYTLTSNKNGEIFTVQKYTDYAMDIDGDLFVFIDGKDYKLYENENGWFAYDITGMEYWHGGLLEGGDMSEFEYDEEKQAYVYKYWEEYGYTIAIRFENGLLVNMTFVDIEDESNVYVREISDIGTTVIDLPDYEIEEKEDIVLNTVTQEEWDALVGETNFEYTIVRYGFTADGDIYADPHSVKSIGSAIEVDGVIYVLENGKYYVLKETADGWIATESTLPAFCFTSLLDGLNYNDYEINSATGNYTPKEVDGSTSYVELQFDENGNLSTLFIYREDFVLPDVDVSIFMSMVGFVDVGNTVIDVPAYTIAQ